MTTKEDIAGWFKQGKESGATHLIVVVDTFDYGDYPVYVHPGEDVHEMKAKHSVDMHRVMEVYRLSDPMEEQLNEPRCFRY